MMAYRLSSLHPLSRYPGPFLCKISKLWIIWLAYRGKLHLYYKSLHDIYGPIVRIGPNDLSINEKKLIPFILGSRGMPKGPIWDARRNRQLGSDREYHAVIDVRDLNIHAQLRRRWNEAFSNEPLKDYQEILAPRVQQLCDHLEELCQSSGGVASFDLAKWISFFAFDFMGDMAFGGGFELMRDQDAQGVWKGMEKGLTQVSRLFSDYAVLLTRLSNRNQSIIQHALWVAVTFQSIPCFSSGMRKFARFAMDQAKRRISSEVKRKDLFYHLVTTADPSNASSYETQLSVAGSDTSASVMSSVMSLLLRHPHAHRRLIDELEEAFPTIDCDDRRIIEVEKLQKLHYLNAVINEAMRLLPPVPSSIQRGPPKGSGGKLLGDDIFIPEGTGVIVPPYCLHRDPRYFSPYPDSFMPERWLAPSLPSSGPTIFHTDKEAFIPFSYGPANCTGKPLALLEVRYVIAHLVTRFDLLLPQESEGSSGRKVTWEDDLEDRFVFTKGPLNVSMRSRRESSSKS
ncbi:cytochrome P450 [Ephemerocybe angulata]|uniref:Cytochrome P450 n=1 Tax=Ephemerocybe angulata TaxID=980116 RepID=A0A8H6HB11_9AGAR|nr:cytochrome P450 [Tulosesus angulatus]